MEVGVAGQSIEAEEGGTLILGRGGSGPDEAERGMTPVRDFAATGPRAPLQTEEGSRIIACLGAGPRARAQRRRKAEE